MLIDAVVMNSNFVWFMSFIQLLSGGLAVMFYEYYLCKAVKKGIKMLSMHHCQLLVRHWNKVIRMWHKIDISFPVPCFSLLLYLLSGIRQFHWILVLLEKKKVHNRCDLRKKEKCIFLCVSRDAVHHDGGTYGGRSRGLLVTLCPLWRNRGWWILVFSLLSPF